MTRPDSGPDGTPHRRASTDDESRLELRPGATAWQRVDDEALLLDVERTQWSGVNRSGMLLWTMLAAGTSRSALVAALGEAFALTQEQAGADVDAFLAQCTARGYLA